MKEIQQETLSIQTMEGISMDNTLKIRGTLIGWNVVDLIS